MCLAGGERLHVAVRVQAAPVVVVSAGGHPAKQGRRKLQRPRGRLSSEGCCEAAVSPALGLQALESMPKGRVKGAPRVLQPVENCLPGFCCAAPARGARAAQGVCVGGKLRKEGVSVYRQGEFPEPPGAG